MEHIAVLQDIGFSGNEARIYLALLKMGSSLVSTIEEETKLNRSHIYERLGKLLERGIASYTIQAGKKYFQVIPPDRVLEKLKEREQRFKTILPELSKLSHKKSSVAIEVYKGKEGLKSVLQDYLKERKDVFILGFSGKVAEQLKYFYPHFQEQRRKLGIGRRIIADHAIRASPLLQEPLTEARFAPREYQSPAAIWVYGDKTVIFLPEEELYMILITSRKIAQFYKNYFTMQWNISEK